MSIERFRANGHSGVHNHIRDIVSGAQFAYKHRGRIISEGKKFGKGVKRKFNELKDSMARKPVHKKRAVAKSTHGARNETGSSTRDVAVKYGKKKKGVVPKKHAVVKVSKHLRAAIKKINEAAKVHGSYRATGYGGIYQGLTNTQQVSSGLGTNYAGLNGSALQNPFYFQWAFNPEDWVHMLSVLFNGKVDVAGTLRGYGVAGTLGNNVNVVNGGAGGGDIANGNVPHPSGVAMNTNGTGLQFHVKSCWEKYILKNISQRTWTIDIYECAPKMVGQETSLYADNATAGSPPIPRVSYPEIQWTNALLAEQHLGVRVDGATPNLLYTSPSNAQFFNQMYKVQKTRVVMEPGQNYEYVMRGPSDLNVDMSKMFRPINGTQDQLFNVQKYSRIPMFVCHQDLELQASSGGGISGGTAGRYGPATGNFISTICIERTQYASFDMPEMVGMQISSNAAGLGTTVTSLQNNLRRPAKFEVVYTQSGVGAPSRIDEENPTNVEQVSN